MAPLTIRLLGSPDITVDGKPLSFRTRKVLALLVFLIVEGGMHRRESLMALLWPETPAQKAAAILRVTLSRLRQTLEPAGEVLITGGGEVGIDFNFLALLDVGWLSKAVLPETDPGDLEAILEFDRGEFLNGFSLPDSPEFDTWAAIQREACQRQVEMVYDRLTQHQLAHHEINTAVETAKRWVGRASLNEAAYRRLMRAQALSGDRTGALRTYAQCQEILRAEFGIEPVDETATLAELIAQDRMQQVPDNTQVGQNSTGPLTSRPASPGLLLPFEGRADEHSRLVAAFRETSKGGAHVVSVIGASGVGKTRLIKVFQEWIALDSPGVEIWNGRAFETGGRLPYQPVIEALRQRLEQENAPEDLLDDVWLAELSQLMPELRARYPDLPAPMTGDADFVRSRLFSAVAILGSALAARQPVVFNLDDMQWADVDTQDMVHYLASRWAESGTPILLLLTIRQENFAADAALREWLAQLGRDVPFSRLLLDPLNGAVVRQLVTRLAGPETDEEQSYAFGDWLWAETQGLPFFIEALLQMLIADGILAMIETEGRARYHFASVLDKVKSGGQVQVPPGVRDAILSRIDRLSEKEGDILLAAAVLGRECSLERLYKVAGITEKQALRTVAGLLNSRLLSENRTARRPYTLAHDYIREVVYNENHEARRRVFHRRALITLEADRAPAAECAFHALASMLDEPAFRFSLAAGDEALSTWAFDDCLAHYDRAQEIARRMHAASAVIDPPALQRLYRNRGRAMELVEDYPAAQANYQEMLELAAERDDQSLELAALIAQCDIHSRYTPLFNAPLAKELGQAALDLARSLNDRAAEATALGGLMFAAVYGGEENRITLAYGEASLAIARELGLKEQMGSVLIHLSWPYTALKKLGAAFDANREAEAVWRELGNLPKLVETYDIRQFLTILGGEQKEVLAVASELLRLSRSIGNLIYQINALMVMGRVHGLQGRFGESLSEIKAGVVLGDESGNPLMKQVEYYYLMGLYINAGALDQAENCADELYSLKDSMMPIFQSVFLNEIAGVKIACGKLDEGEALMEQALELCGTDNMWSHNVIWIAITEAYLQLALGTPERAFSRLEEGVQSYRQAGYRFNLTEELWLRGRVHLASGEIEAAKEMLLEAKAEADDNEEDLFLWQILATLSENEMISGNEAEAEKLRLEACKIINTIADRAGDEEDYQASFLGQPQVARVLAGSWMRIPQPLA